MNAEIHKAVIAAVAEIVAARDARIPTDEIPDLVKATYAAFYRAFKATKELPQSEED